MKKVLLVFVSAFFIASNSFAQGNDMSSVRRNVATIIFCGIGGAVLGLSTLSFYGAPQEHVSNITAGFALGLISGTAYVTATSMKDSMNNNQETAFYFPQMGPPNPHQVALRPLTVWRFGWDF